MEVYCRAYYSSYSDAIMGELLHETDTDYFQLLTILQLESSLHVTAGGTCFESHYQLGQ